MKRKLVLENGVEFIGTAFGSDAFSVGEVVFTTSMTGYQETLSDPSYHKQIVVFTYPLIGNYGINKDDFESLEPSIGGLVVREFAEVESHWQSQKNLNSFLKEKKIPGLSGIDTRALVKIIREGGSIKGKFSNLDQDSQSIRKEIQTTNLENHVPNVSTKQTYFCEVNKPIANVVLIDYGFKKSILDELLKRKCQVHVVPHNTSSKKILELKPDGIMLSNGPGNPSELKNEIQTIAELNGKVPIFGICLGHQLYALSQGATTYKLKFGHRGGNHSVKDLNQNRVFITSQNHGYAVDKESLKGTGLTITHLALNDDSIEGLSNKKSYAFTVQYHPESCPGPSENSYLFDEFLKNIQAFKQKNSSIS